MLVHLQVVRGNSKRLPDALWDGRNPMLGNVVHFVEVEDLVVPIVALIVWTAEELQ